jgi:asparagine synthase (glutamine-hydrolysing)
MPGITGIIGKIIDKATKKTVHSMVRAMLHEDSYVSGDYLDKDMGVGVGWVSHKGSFSDCMPIWNEKKDICLFFSGEDFTDLPEIERLKANGHVFDANSAGYLVHLYEEKGDKFIEELNGSFSGILIDTKERKTILFIDRFGLNRIYYHEEEDCFYFSSEAKSLLKILPELRRLDFDSLGEVLSCGCTLGNKTLYRGISLLPGSSKWTFDPQGKAQRSTYFKSDVWENQSVLSEQEYYNRLKDMFSHILPRYFRGRQRVAVSLTGGIDTRMIMAWAPCQPFKIPCYTFGGIYRESADVKIAREIASVCQQKHETITVNKKFFAEFPALAKRAVYYTDGTMDVSGAVELFVNRLVKSIAPIRLTGNYGDQVLRGVMGFKPAKLNERMFDAEFLDKVRNGIGTYNEISRGSSKSFWAFKQLPWHHYSRLALENTQITPRSPFLDNELMAVAFQAPSAAARSVDTSLRLIADGDPALGKIATDRGVRFKPIPFVNRIERLYHELTIKAEYAYDYGMPQWLTKIDNRFASMHFEKYFLGRHKYYHFRTWYRNELADYVKGIILDPRTIGLPFFRGKYLEEIVECHIKGERNFTREINCILTCALLQRNLIEQK